MKAWSCQASRVITWKETSRRGFVTLLHFFVQLVISVHIESHLMKEMQVAIELTTVCLLLFTGLDRQE